MKIDKVITEAIANGTLLGTDTPTVVQKLFQAVTPTSTPTSVQDAMKKAAAAFGVTSPSQSPAPEQNILANVLTLIQDGFTSSDIVAVASGAVCPPSIPFQNFHPN
jgi:hypothetical protein